MIKKSYVLSAILIFIFSRNLRSQNRKNIELKFYSPFQNFFVDDRDGILNSIKLEQRIYQKKVETFRNWNLLKTGIFEESIESKKYFKQAKKSILKYYDKRLSNYIKKNKDKKTIRNIKSVEAALRGTTKFELIPNYKLILKARVLQRYAVLHFQNPLFKMNLFFNIKGQWDFTLRKEFNYGAVEFHIDKYEDDKKLVAKYYKYINNFILSELIYKKYLEDGREKYSEEKIIVFKIEKKF